MYIGIYVYVHAVFITLIIKLNRKGLRYTMKILIQLILSCNCETNLPISVHWGKLRQKKQCLFRTRVKLAGALTIEMVPPCFSIRACPNPRERPRVLGILIIIHSMLFSVAMVLCILISVSTCFTCAPENIIERNKHPKPEMHRTE